jgi:hypothetical protein
LDFKQHDLKVEDLRRNGLDQWGLPLLWMPSLSLPGKVESVPPVGVRNFGQQVCIRSLKLQRAPKPTAILLTDLARRVVTAVETFVRRSDMLLPRGVPLMRPDGKDSVARARAGAHSPAEPPSPLANQVSAPRWNSIYPGKPFSVSW